MLDWLIIIAALPDYFEGLKITLLLLVISMSTGFVLSLALAVARVSPNPWVSRPVWLYTYVFRGTPLLVQLFMLYYGLAQFEWVRSTYAWYFLKSAWFCTWLAFVLNTTAYTTEIFAGALRTTPPGELEAARAFGLTGPQLYRRILIPSALRRALPQYGNEVVMMMHATAIASAVSIVELTRVARDVYFNTLMPAEAFGTVAVFYFVLTFAMVGIFKLIERRVLKHLRPRKSGPGSSGPVADQPETDLVAHVR